MVKYPKSQYKFVRYEKSSKAGKMYSAILKNKENDREVKIHFGDNKLGNYQDKTGLNAYPKLTHGDKQRRKNFRSRFSGLKQKQDWKNFYTPLFFSWTKLW